MSLSVQVSSAAESKAESNNQPRVGAAPGGVTMQQLVTAPVVMRTGRSFGGYWYKVWQILAKDLRIEMRAKEIIVVMASFSALAVIIFGMAFDLRIEKPTMVVPGVLWGVLLFSGTLGLNRSFSAEADRQTLMALLLAPVDRTALYLGKFFANLIFLLLMTLVLLPVILFIFDVNLFRFWILVALALGIIGYVGVGTLFAALTATIRARESMLPILLLPVLAPVFMAGIKVTEQVLDGRDWSDFQNWLGMLTGFDLIFLTAAFLVFDLIWEEA